MKPSINPRGYYIATLCVNGRPRSFSLHKLIALQFVPNDDPKNKAQVNHIDGNKLNNKVENLEWVTPKENMRHSVEVLGNFREDRNWRARAICGVDIKTNVVKYKFTSLMGAARFFAKSENLQYIFKQYYGECFNTEGVAVHTEAVRGFMHPIFPMKLEIRLKSKNNL